MSNESKDNNKLVLFKVVYMRIKKSHIQNHYYVN